MYLKRFIIVLTVSLALCYASGRYFDGKYRKNFATLFFNDADTLVDKTKNYDVILLGNSRVHFGLNPFYIDSVTGLSSYNFAIGGSDASMLWLNTALYLQHRPAPAYAVIGTDVSFLVENDAIRSQYHYLYYLDNDIVYTSLRRNNPAVRLAKWIPFLKYTLFNEYNRRFLFRGEQSFPQFDHNIYRGFINPHNGRDSTPAIEFAMDKNIQPFSPGEIKLVEKTISLLKKAGSTVIFVSPPLKENISPSKKKYFENADSIFISLAEQYDVSFFRATDLRPYDNTFFTDDLHLNDPGATIFSIQVGEIIKASATDKKRVP